MKKIFNYIMVSLAATASLLSVSCIDEVEPTSGVTDEQLSSSLKSTEALLWGMPAKMVEYDGALGQEYHYDWGNGTVMHMRDVMGDEYAVTYSSYDWYDSWENNQYLSENYANAQLPWQTLYKQILTANKLIAAIDTAKATSDLKGMYAAGLAYRALNYLDAARMYEYLPTDGTQATNVYGNNVQGLTVPIVTESTTEEASRTNPRASHYAMFDFIIKDLDQAEKWISLLTFSDKSLPHLGVVYGLKARAYLWHASFMEQYGTDAATNGGVPSDSTQAYKKAISAEKAYELAETYAEDAISLGENDPLTKDEWLNTTDGFNTPVSSWMLYIGTVKENGATQTGIINWTSWCSNETTYGYASAGPIVCAGASFYDGISDYDFRKLSFKAPADTKLAGQEPRLVDDETFEGYPDYASLKFRPGSGNMTDYNVGSASCIPLMRIEEMVFIAAEAKAHHKSATDGRDYLATFMKDNRNGRYSFKATDRDSIVTEILKQKRIEFWGEGINYFDIKRCNIPVTRVYEGTNFNDDAQFNTTTRPAWMNWVIVRNEGTNNKSVKEWNNPDPSDCYESGVAAKNRNYSNPFEVFAAGRGLKKPISNIKF